MLRKIITGMLLPTMVIIVTLFVTRWYLLQPPDDVTLANGARLEWTSCWFSVPVNQVVHCARLYPSLQNAGKSISLPVVVYKNISLQHKPDPVLFINGGPGDANGLDTDSWSYYIKTLDWQRDFIVFDHRGTGLSEPKPECQSLYDFYYDVITQKMEIKEESRKSFYKATQCYRTLSEQGNDLSGYSTLDSAQDVRDLIETMDYSQWNLFGVSYGTRVALEILRSPQDNIRSVILDSVYPANKHSLFEWPALLNNAMEMIFRYCEADEQCRSSYPDLRALFVKAMSELKEKPVRLHLPDFYSDGSLDVYINDFRFMMALYMAMYNHELLASMPAAIDDAAYGAHHLMIPVVTAYADFMLDTEFNDAIYYSVECNDNKLITEKAYEAEVRRYPWLMHYHKYDWWYNVCRNWSTGANKELSVEPVRSDIPTLILSGKYDPVTPWQWAKEVQKHLPNSFHFVFPDVAHAVLGSDDCALQTSRDFLNHPEALPQQTCLQAQR